MDFSAVIKKLLSVKTYLSTTTYANLFYFIYLISKKKKINFSFTECVEWLVKLNKYKLHNQFTIILWQLKIGLF